MRGAPIPCLAYADGACSASTVGSLRAVCGCVRCKLQEQVRRPRAFPGVQVSRLSSVGLAPLESRRDQRSPHPMFSSPDTQVVDLIEPSSKSLSLPYSREPEDVLGVDDFVRVRRAKPQNARGEASRRPDPPERKDTRAFHEQLLRFDFSTQAKN